VDYTHRADLITAQQLAMLRERSNWRAGVHLLGHVLLIGSTATALHFSLPALLHSFWGSVWCVLVFLLHGVALNWLYAAQHEMMHHSAFRSALLNEIGSRITGFIVLFPRDLDRIAHFRHHRYTNDLQHDPELSDVQPDAAPPSAAALAWRLCGVMYWLRRVRYLFSLSAGDTTLVAFMTPAERRCVVREARWHTLLYLAVALAAVVARSWAPLLYWIGPLLLARGAHEIQNLCEHTGRPLVGDVLINSRVIRTNVFMRWLGWNMQYHCHHHLFAAVPFYRLPELDRLVGERLPAPLTYGQAIAEILHGAVPDGPVPNGPVLNEPAPYGALDAGARQR